MHKKKLLLLFILIFAFSTFTTVFADDLNTKKSQLNNVNKNVSNIKGKINSVKSQKNDVLADINQIQGQINSTSSQIDSINSKISSTQDSIKKVEKELNAATDDFNQEKGLYKDRVRALYMNGPSGYIEILLTSKSFSDFISRADSINLVIDFDKKMLKTMKQKEDIIQSKKVELEKVSNNLTNLNVQLASRQNELNGENSKKKSYYAQLDKNQDQLEKMLEAEEQEAKALQNQIRSIQAKLNHNVKYTGSKTGILRVSDIGYVPRITSPFGMRFHPILKKNIMHYGIDIGVPSGTPVYAMADGVVIIAGVENGYGNVVVIDHGSGLTTLYAHNSKLLVSRGEKVTKGQMISKSGSTGYATGPHLHFEVAINGTQINPEPYLIIGK